MPCTDGGYGEAMERERLSREHRLLSKMLCAALKVLHKNKLGDQIDYKEGGFTNAELQLWWSEHQREDALRKDRERRKAEDEKARQAALRKLTLADRMALGIKDKIGKDW